MDADTFLVEYLDTHVLELELNRARGWDYDPIGVARVPLRQVTYTHLLEGLVKGICALATCPNGGGGSRFMQQLVGVSKTCEAWCI